MILSNVTKRYQDFFALKNINCEIAEGEITAVLGESGAGKTTLLNILAGLTAYEGEIDGVPGGKAAQKEECSYLFQDAKLLPNLSAEGNLKFVLKKDGWEKIPEMLSRVGLAGKEKAYPHELSGGEKQRVAIARAFLYPHKLLLMDEPFSSLDLSLKKSLIELVVALWREKRSTVVFVTHDVREAALLAHRALVLKGGEIVFDVQIATPLPRDFLSPPPEMERLVQALLHEKEEGDRLE